MSSGDKILPSKPLGSYMQFVRMRRATVVAENPGVKNTDVLKLLGELWRDLGDEGKKEFELAAAEDKQRYERELAKLRADGVDVDELIAGRAAARAGAGSASGDFVLPMQRVKRIAKSHPKVKTVSTEATNALVAAVGMFVESLASESAVQTQRAGRKTVRMVEMRSVILRSALRDFISPDDFPAPTAKRPGSRSTGTKGKGGATKPPAGANASAGFMKSFLAKEPSV